MNISIRKGTIEDIPQALQLIKELAEYENALDQVQVDESQMKEDGFGPEPVFEFIVAQLEQEIVGIAIYYNRYSTWKGRSLYLEDLVVTETLRGKGIGGKLFLATIQAALEGGANLLTWQVLDWNEPAIKFYKKLDSAFDSEWINCKLTREQMEQL